MKALVGNVGAHFKGTQADWDWVLSTAAYNAGPNQLLNKDEFYKWVNLYAYHFGIGTNSAGPIDLYGCTGGGQTF